MSRDDTFDPKAFLRTLTPRPGVYRMLNAAGEVLYVGKARNLKQRVASYFRASGVSPKTRALMSQVHDIQVTVTHTEAEALLLESNLIKSERPRYNVLLRDDKSYPYIYLSSHQTYPRLALHRGARRAKGRYFGPYPNAHSVRESLNLLQKVFKVRQCEDSFFRNRSRPCLQYQIKRCSGPCVGLVSPEEYAEAVRHTEMFLEGQSNAVAEELERRMSEAAAGQRYEAAAEYRDRIAHLRRVQERQYISGEKGDLDIAAARIHGGSACVQVFYIRGGRNLGNKTFFPRLPPEADTTELLAAFLGQYYLERTPPAELLVNEAPADAALLEEVLGEKAGRRVRIRHRVRGERARWVEMAVTNADAALQARLSSQAGVRERLAALQAALGLDEQPQRIECFDISHTRGEATVAACVVFDGDGPLKSDYRRFNIEDVTPGDDYGALAQALSRRYTRIQKGEGKLPDLLLIDGGRGQVSAVRGVLAELAVADVPVVGVTKGPGRRPAFDTLTDADGHKIQLAADSPALHLVQQIRDEAHRFAITGHRQRRARARGHSALEDIPGIGPGRRQQLLRHFGGLQEVARAGVEDLARVKGISRDLARSIYDAFHGEGH